MTFKVTDAFYTNEAGVLVPFRKPNLTPPPAPMARQIIGMTVPSSGASFSTNVNQVEEERRLAELYGWTNGGPPVQRIFRQQQGPPFSMLTRIVAEGRIPWISLKPSTGGVAADKAGANDAHWIAWGNEFKGLRRDGAGPNQILFTYDHENDRHTHSGAADNNSTGWRNYQADWRDAFRRIIGLMRGTDPTHGLDHVTFVMIWTGWGFRSASNRDPGASWHPDFDMVASDPYDEYINNRGEQLTTHRQFYSLGSTSTGLREHYEWCSDPLTWYSTYHPSWSVPSIVTDNLDKFPVRMGVAETGTQFRMVPNSNNTLWVPLEDPDSLDSQQAKWLAQMAKDLRETVPRLEVVCYWPESTAAIGSSSGKPNYFHGPAANRWGCEWAGPIAALRAETIKPNHHGTLTPWSPQGLITI